MERVSIRQGKNPILFVAPHGPDDTNTSIIAETAAEICDGYYVINNGFERKGNIVDVENDRANCNRIDHVIQDVVKEEFLNPIEKFTAQMRSKLQIHHFLMNYSEICKPLIFYIHGAGDHVHIEVGEKISVIVGYGLGKKKGNDSFTCENWRRKLFVQSYRSYSKAEVYEGLGGSYNGRNPNNMNQFYRQYISNSLIDSMQLEFPYLSRFNKLEAEKTGLTLATVANEILNHDPTSALEINPKPKFI